MSNADLRALAEKATPGPWEADGKIIRLGVTARPDPDDHYNVTYWESVGTIYDEGGHTEDDATYICAASPDRVIALLDELDFLKWDYEQARTGLRAENERLRAALVELLGDTQHAEHDCGDVEYCPVLHARAALAG